MSTPTSFKTLHSFVVNLDKEVTETTTREENGQKITVESKSIKSVPTTVLLKEPSRRERQELTLFQQVTYNKAIELGLLPKIVMQQKLAKDSGALSVGDDKSIAAMAARLHELSTEYLRLTMDKAPETDETKTRKEKLLQEYGALYQRAEELNASYQSVYAYTADTYTQNKTLSWLLLFLTYARATPGAAPTPMFAGSDFTAKENHAGDMDDAGDLLWKAVTDKDRLNKYWQLYLFNQANKTEDFVKHEEEWKRLEDARAKMAEDAAKAEEKTKVETPTASEAVVPPAAESAAGSEDVAPVS